MQSAEHARAPASKKRTLLTILKLALSLAILGEIYRRVLLRDGAEEILGHLGRLHWAWFALAVCMQLVAIGFGIARWKLLLRAQGLRAPVGFLTSSWMIGRFWGAVTPGGLGLDGWRLYDTAKQTGKVARATAVAGVEKVLGQLAFGMVVMAGSLFGLQFIGWQGVLLVNGFFATIVTAGLLLLSRPGLFRSAERLLPARIRPRLATLIEAVFAFHGKGGLLSQAVLLGVGVHAFNNFIYVCAARALDVDLSVGAVFFASSLQIMATLVPASINGMGLREAAAVALYTSPAVGLSLSQAVLIPTVGFAAEMFVSAFGALVFVLRPNNYAPHITIEDPEREARVQPADAVVAPEARPRLSRALALGVGAGLVAGALLGIAESSLVLASGRTDFFVVPYGTVAYALFCGAVGGVGLLVLAWVGRRMGRAAQPEPRVYARTLAALTATFAFAIGAFRIRRDVFAEELVFKSGKGLLVLLGCALAALALCAALSWLVHQVVKRRGRFLLRGWGSPALVGAVVAVLLAVLPFTKSSAEKVSAPIATARTGAGNVLVIVVDTLRADHLPAYGYDAGRTPHLDAFAEDAVRFEHAYANASWTRPSFASLLTGRYASSHQVMAKGDALPQELTTLSEAFLGAGYSTSGFVTNYNVAPYFQFDQGFQQYHYLEPEFVLGADDAAAKLLLVQFLRQRIETVRDAFWGVQPGTAYQDAAVVNSELFRWLEQKPASPWFLFVGYMDPHDPYFEHPYSGAGYGRAAHPRPAMHERERLTALYDGEIAYWDEHFGALMARLKAEGMYDDTTIVVTSDHGEEFGEHGGFWHGTTLYDEQLRVPLLVKLPKGARAGSTVSHWVQTIDLMPSLLRWSQIPVPEGVQGHDLLVGHQRVFAEESHEGNVLEAVREKQANAEVKLITANPGNPRGLKQRELYRVDRDPGEVNDLSEQEPNLLGALERALQKAGEDAKKDAVQAEDVALDAESRKQLCALGYLSPEECK